MNCWAALGMDAAAGEAAYADAQKSSDKQDLDPEAFEDDGKDEFKGMEKKEKKKAKKSKREKEEAKHAGGVLGMFAVKRVCLQRKQLGSCSRSSDRLIPINTTDYRSYS